MFEAGLAVVERDPPVESLIELDLGSGEAEAPCLGRDLQAAALPLHDVVVADDAFVPERTDAVQIVGRETPGCGGVARSAREAPVVVGEEASQHPVGGVEITSMGKAEFAAQAILKNTPEAFDAAFGLRRLRGDESDAELLQGPAELRGLAPASEFFFHRPVIVMVHEDAAAISVEGGGNAEAAEQALQQAEIACGRFRREELSGEDFAGGIVLHAQSGEARTAPFQPVVRAAVELHEFPFARGAQTALAMSGSAAFSGRADTRLAQEAAKRLAAEGEAFDLLELFREVMVVEAEVAGARQVQDALAQRLREATGAGPPATGVCHRRLTALPIARFEALHLSRR